MQLELFKAERLIRGVTSLITHSYFDPVDKTMKIGFNIPTEEAEGDYIHPTNAAEKLRYYLYNEIFPILIKEGFWDDLSISQKSVLIALSHLIGPHFLKSPKFENIYNALKRGDFVSVAPMLKPLDLQFTDDFMESTGIGKNYTLVEAATTNKYCKLWEVLENKIKGDLEYKFSKLYRDNEDGSSINMKLVPLYYKGLPHQISALKWLEDQITSVIKENIKSLNIVDLKVPYFSQRDNTVDPYQTCNVTSCAMVCSFYGIKPKDPSVQLEDEIEAYITKKYGEERRYYHDTLEKVLGEYGVEDKFLTNALFDDLRTNIRQGNPVIYSGKFTPSGHIIVIRGFDDNSQEWIVNDPYGEYFPSGYQNKSGEGLKYSYSLLRKVSYSRPNCWAHLIQGKK